MPGVKPNNIDGLMFKEHMEMNLTRLSTEDAKSAAVHFVRFMQFYAKTREAFAACSDENLRDQTRDGETLDALFLHFLIQWNLLELPAATG